VGQALNTTVNGSSGTCVAAADWLRSLAEAGHQAAGDVRGAHTSAEAGWQGPASSAFQDSIANVDRVADDVAGRASNCERGLRADTRSPIVPDADSSPRVPTSWSAALATRPSTTGTRRAHGADHCRASCIERCPRVRREAARQGTCTAGTSPRGLPG
jgi:hypothetical protein